MYIDRLLFPIESLGPGKRLVLWTKGCSKHCRNCANPELWETGAGQGVSVEDLFTIICNIHKETVVEGITITGGDPLEQREELLELTERLNTITSDILVYTGYCWEELENSWSSEILSRIRKNIAVMIDGPYIEALNIDSLTLMGSSNQNIIYFNPAVKASYEAYIKGGRRIQNVYMGERMISVGMHGRKEVDE